MINQKIFVLGVFLCATCVLSGCSPFSRKPSTSTVESVAKTYINDNAKPAGRKYSEGVGYGKKYYYPMVDDHGIEFNVIVVNKKVELIEGYIPFLYNKYLFYTTDYKERIMAYHTREIEDILKEAGFVDYMLWEHEIKINITENDSLEDLATVMITVDDLLDYNYRYQTITQDSLGDNQYWDIFDTYDIIIEQRGSNNELLLFESFLFSDNNGIVLTHDKVLKTLELAQMMRTSDTEVKIIQVNGELYWDSGEITQDKMTGEMDGTARTIIDRVPKQDDQANFGPGSVDYQFAPDETLYVFLSDGRHVFVKY